MAILAPQEWKQIPSFPAYEASSLGYVRRIERSRHGTRYLRDDRTFTPCPNRKGYPQISLRNHAGRVRSIAVHRLVAEAFLGPCPAGLQVNHIDGCKENNAVSNLEYVTSSQNQSHACRMGLCRTPRKRSLDRAYKLTERDVREILSLEGKQTLREIAKQFGVCTATIQHIFSGRLWSHLTGRTLG